MSRPADRRPVLQSAVAPTRPEQPRLYADLLAEVERRRRATDDILVRGMIMVRDPR